MHLQIARRRTEDETKTTQPPCGQAGIGQFATAYHCIQAFADHIDDAVVEVQFQLHLRIALLEAGQHRQQEAVADGGQADAQQSAGACCRCARSACASESSSSARRQRCSSSSPSSVRCTRRVVRWNSACRVPVQAGRCACRRPRLTGRVRGRHRQCCLPPRCGRRRAGRRWSPCGDDCGTSGRNQRPPSLFSGIAACPSSMPLMDGGPHGPIRCSLYLSARSSAGRACGLPGRAGVAVVLLCRCSRGAGAGPFRGGIAHRAGLVTNAFMLTFGSLLLAAGGSRSIWPSAAVPAGHGGLHHRHRRRLPCSHAAMAGSGARVAGRCRGGGAGIRHGAAGTGLAGAGACPCLRPAGHHVRHGAGVGAPARGPAAADIGMAQRVRRGRCAHVGGLRPGGTRVA